MIIPLLSLLLAAAPAPPSAVVLEPAPPAEFKRLQPQRVVIDVPGSGTDQNGDFPPIAVADDDPATAWLREPPGSEYDEPLEWWGPCMGARHFKVFIRSGYQSSRKLLRAHGRPHRVRVTALLRDDYVTELPGMAPEKDLVDEAGWQEIDVEAPGEVAGFQISILSIFPGVDDQRPAISDLRVYGDAGGGSYRSDVVGALGEHVRQFLASRKAASARESVPRHTELLQKYVLLGDRIELPFPAGTNIDASSLPRLFTMGSARLADLPEEAKARVARAASLIGLYDTVVAAQSGTPAGWREATLTAHSGSRDAQERLKGLSEQPGSPDDPLSSLSSFLVHDDFSTAQGMTSVRTRVTTTITALHGAAWTRDPYAPGQPEAELVRKCITPCMAILQPAWPTLVEAADDPNWGWTIDEACDAECGKMPYSQFDDWLSTVAQSRALVRGPMTSPTAVYRMIDAIEGDREPSHDHHEGLVVYSEGLASEVLTAETAEPDDGLVRSFDAIAHVLDWRKDARTGRPRLVRITTFTLASGYQDKPSTFTMAVYGEPERS